MANGNPIDGFKSITLDDLKNVYGGVLYMDMDMEAELMAGKKTSPKGGNPEA